MKDLLQHVVCSKLFSVVIEQYTLQVEHSYYPEQEEQIWIQLLYSSSNDDDMFHSSLVLWGKTSQILELPKATLWCA